MIEFLIKPIIQTLIYFVNFIVIGFCYSAVVTECTVEGKVDYSLAPKSFYFKVMIFLIILVAIYFIGSAIVRSKKLKPINQEELDKRLVYEHRLATSKKFKKFADAAVDLEELERVDKAYKSSCERWEKKDENKVG